MGQLAERTAAGATRTAALAAAASAPPVNEVADRDRLIAATAAAAKFYANKYFGSWAPAYLRHRIGQPIDRTLSEVGYSPAEWTALTDHLRAGGFTDTEILTAGLATEASTGRLIDRFRDRVVFPIRNNDHDVVGFVGRRNPTADRETDTRNPKYLNTATTPLYDKSTVLFGLSDAHDAIAEGGPVVLVEGPIDAVAVTQASAGTMAGVAALGTALTDRHAAALRDQLGAESQQIVVALDADDAGHNGARKAHARLGAVGLDPRGVTLPAGLDPADIAQRHGSAALFDSLDTTVSLTQQVVTRAAAGYDLDIPEHRGFALRAAVQTISHAPSRRGSAGSRRWRSKPGLTQTRSAASSPNTSPITTRRRQAPRRIPHCHLDQLPRLLPAVRTRRRHRSGLRHG